MMISKQERDMYFKFKPWRPTYVFWEEVVMHVKGKKNKLKSFDEQGRYSNAIEVHKAN